MSEIIDLNVWLDAKRKKNIESFKIKHPAQYACIKELGRKQGALEELKRFKEIWMGKGSYPLDEMYSIECSLKKYLEKRIKELEEAKEQ